MATLILSHNDCINHEVSQGHPERPDRMRALDKAFSEGQFDALIREDAPLGDLELAQLCHPAHYVDKIVEASPKEGRIYLDGDTQMSPGSLNAARRGLGAITKAIDDVMSEKIDNAFCRVRPPGHHAEKDVAMGFCLFNTIAIGAYYARENYSAERVAVVDFDVHHGNGTQDIFWSDKNMFFGSTHQMPLFPGSGHKSETGVGNIFNAPLRAGDGSVQFKEAVTSVILPALRDFQPDLILVSAGFDAHHLDPLAQVDLTADDFDWVTRKLLDLSDECCEGRLVSILEGGYSLEGLAESAKSHVNALMDV